MLTYFTGVACKHGHIAPRRKSNRECTECASIYMKAYSARRYQENIESERAKRRQHYLANRQDYIDAARRNEAPYIRKTEGIRNKSLQPGYGAAMQAKYQASKAQRTPAWADLTAIEQFYNDCPEGYEVDHIVPLNGRYVSGLHVLENLQYLTRSENASKGNRYAS